MQEKSTGLDIIIRHLDNPQEEQLKKDVELFCSLSAGNATLFKEIEAIWHAGVKVALLFQINASGSAGHFQEILSRKLKSGRGKLWRPLLYAVAAVFLVFVFYADFLIAGEYSDKNKGIFHNYEAVNRPFKVSLGSSAAVWGTLFNIKKDNLRVGEGVKSGEILFTPLEARQTFLLKTVRGVNYDVKNNIVAETSAAKARQTKNLVFPDSPIEDVFRQLSGHYGISFALSSFKNDYREKKWNALFANEPLYKELDILKLTYLSNQI